MKDSDIEKLEKKFDIIIKLLSKTLIEDKNKTESIIYLSQIGISNKEIANIVNTSPNTVRARISENQ